MKKRRGTHKRLFAVLLAAILTFALSAPVFARQGYYYTQLTAAEKQYFEAMENNKDLSGFKDEISIQGKDKISSTSIRRVLTAFFYDNVDVFWVDQQGGINFGAGDLDGDTEWGLKWSKKYDWSKGNRSLSADTTALDKAAQALADKAAKETTNRDKLKVVHDELINTNEYNKDAAKNASYYSTVSGIPWTALSTLVSGTKGPVCEGYARAFKLVCDKLGITCMVVSGTGKTKSGSEQHMWNYVQLEGKWYAADVTWDDPTGSGSGAKSGAEREIFFLVGSDTVCDGSKFSSTHIPKEEDGIAYPTLEKTALSGGGGDTPSPSPTPTPTPTPTTKKATSITITPSSPGVSAINETVTLTPNIKPDGATQEVIWTITSGKGEFVESGIDKYTGTGAVTLKVTSSGDVKVKAQVNDSGKKNKVITIKGPKAPSSISVSGRKTITEKDNNVDLTATVKPVGQAVYEKVKWTCTDNATVVSTGKDTCTVTLKEKASGDVTVTASVLSKGKWKSYKYKLKGPKAPSGISISCSNPKKTISDDGTPVTLTATVKPKGQAVYDKVVWEKVSGDNGNIQSIDEANDSCTVVCDGSGNIVIKASVKSGSKWRSAKITLKGPRAVTGVKINKPDTVKSYSKLTVGQKFTLKAEAKPANALAKDKVITWSSSDPSKVKIDEKTGDVECLAACKDVEITAKSGNGKTKTIKVTVS